jgi:signal transduction histidine kinase
LRRLSGHLERVKEQERARIAREIHDDIGGTLTGLRADLAWIKKRYAGDPGMAEKLESMSTLLDSTMQASVRIARDLRPPILDFGFAAAIEWQALDFQKRTGVQCRGRCAQEITLDADRATAVFRIFQELLTNIAKHARASHVEVVLRTEKSRLHLEVDDDGVGLSEADRNKRDSYGIRGMIERARELNGRLVFHRPLRGGTRALLELPVAGQ